MGVADVTRLAEDPDLELAELPGEVLCFDPGVAPLVQEVERDVDALSRQVQGDRPPDPGGAPGYDRAPSPKLVPVTQQLRLGVRPGHSEPDRRWF